MNFNHVTHKKVVEQYNIYKIFKPLNIGNGELENVSISDLRKELDFCFLDIESYSQKEFLLDYVEDYSLELRASKIPSQRNILKQLKNRIKKLKKRHPNLDINSDDDEIILNEINGFNWKLDQEKYILHYLKEQKNFIQNWVSEKRKELAEKPLKDWIKKERSNTERKILINKVLTNIPKPQLDYIELGALFAQGFIKRDKDSFYFKKNKFSILAEVSDYVKDAILTNKVNNVRQYIGATLNGKGQKNFFESKKMMANIIEYCQKNNIEITHEFQSIYHDLMN